jgi:hypothetical protein
MKANFNVEKEARKALVKTLGEITGLTPVYQKAPSLAFAVGGYTVSRYGSIDFGSEGREVVLSVLVALAEKGFAFEGGMDGFDPAAPTQDAPPAGGADVTAAESDSDPGVLSIDMPLDGFTASALDNLERLVTAKTWIIQRMTGADELTVAREDGRLRFPWFRPESSAAETDAYTRLVAALCDTAKNKQRVTATERRPKDGDNEKFKARCFLLSLGFIGDDTKQARKVLLEGFSGNGSHSTGNGRVKTDKVIAPFVSAGLASPDDNGGGDSVPQSCGECRYHGSYTGGVMFTNAGDAVDTSKRTPDNYAHYCLNTPRGYRKLKGANDWSGLETPPKWCPLVCSVVSGAGDALAEAPV